MLCRPVSDRDLRLQVADMRAVYPRLKHHELFLVWFLHAMVTDDLGKAAAALTGNPNDKSADAILVDDRAKATFVVQGKYRGTLNGANEHRSDLLTFVGLAPQLVGGNEEFRLLVKGADPRVEERLREVRERVTKRGYTLSTTGS